MGYFFVLESSFDESFHVTLLPEFDFDENSNSVGHFISDAEFMLSGFEFDKGFSIVGKSEQIFTKSDGTDILVLVVDDSNKKLLKVHSVLLYLADLYGAKFVNPSIIGDYYCAHISGADMTTKLPVFDTVSLSKRTYDGFDKNVLKFD